ncbi:MAG: N-6 DNA methylase [Saprospiraceae bacterium]|nr:N-6 DNA methylase [Saprospiraceae bacterium]
MDKLVLFKTSQKLIDRFLFVFFCEDNNGLLPANSIAEIIKHWNKLREMDEYRPLYDIFKKYFEYINVGRPASSDRQEIFAYNGGLFSEDPLLDVIHISDTVLYTHAQKLSGYDFISEVDVNILGHIFEHSLNELEELQAQLEGQTIDKTKTKRKKDGVFYTPRYITEYIVENTIGKLCNDKKESLNLVEDEFVLASSPTKRKTLHEKLQNYKTFLLSLTICDPACGSGAFLNQAFLYLQKQHQYIADLESKLFDTPLALTDVSADILEHNLFGVDINEESVEIARLSLWLRSARRGRKLNNLSSNIKCGNSLIDDHEVAGDKAFKWEEEFPHVFAKGGFDVVIGNPPYVKARDNENIKERRYIEKNYFSAYKMWDLYIPFIEKGINILKGNGSISMIIPDTIGKAEYSMKLINTIESKNYLYQIDFFQTYMSLKM